MSHDLSGADRHVAAEEADAFEALRHGRLVVVALTLLAIALTLVYPLRTWVYQHNQIATLQADERAMSENVAALRQELARWDDPEHVKNQARRQLFYSFPGEAVFTIVELPAQGEASAQPGPGTGELPVEPRWSCTMQLFPGAGLPASPAVAGASGGDAAGSGSAGDGQEPSLNTDAGPAPGAGQPGVSSRGGLFGDPCLPASGFPPGR